jgi:MshEN domain
MASPGPPQKATVQSRPRWVRIVLRDGEVVEGGIYLNEGQALAPYLSTRKGGWVNIIKARWLAEDETHNHAVLQADHILLAISMDGDIPVYGSTAGAATRDVDIALEDASHVRGTLHLLDKQRLSDYLHSCGKFLPVLGAVRSPPGGGGVDCVVNCMSIRVIRDAKVFESGSMDVAPEIAAEARPSIAMSAIEEPAPSPHPLQKETVRRDTGSIEVITEGRHPDRRLGRTYTSPTGSQALAVKEPATMELSAVQRELSEKLARHWLVQLATGAQLSPPDPREMTVAPELEEIWAGLARRNDMPEAELAVQVALAFKLPVANLADVSAEALASIPERVARKLGVIPVGGDAKNLIIALSDPSSMEIEQQLGFVTRKRLLFQVAPPSDIRGALDWHYKASAPG